MLDDFDIFSELEADKAWEFVLTVSEGKRLIAKGVAALPSVREAMEDGIVVVTKGTTNAYVAEELLGREIPKRSYVLGRTVPAKWSAEGFFTGSIPEVILRNGKLVEDVTLAEIMDEMSAGDVVIKGANALDYENQVAGLLIGDPRGGTLGTIIGHVYGKGLNLVIPVGLEKQLSQPLADPFPFPDPAFAAANNVSRLWAVQGIIVTEIDALGTLTDAAIFQIGAGGVCGAEGASRLVAVGTEDDVEEVRELVESIQGELAFEELET